MHRDGANENNVCNLEHIVAKVLYQQNYLDSLISVRNEWADEMML